MDSKLDPVYRALFRHAEHSGDRQDVKREEATGGDGRRKDDREPSERPDPWQDDAAVSVIALRAFLINLLGGEPAPVTVPPPATARPTDPATARAAGAYRTTAAHQAPPAIAPAAPVTSATPAPGLTSDDIRTIRTLIATLDRLSSRQIDMLRIEKNGTFLQSLAAAADRALAIP